MEDAEKASRVVGPQLERNQINEAQFTSVSVYPNGQPVLRKWYDLKMLSGIMTMIYRESNYVVSVVGRIIAWKLKDQRNVLDSTSHFQRKKPNQLSYHKPIW